MKALDSKSIIKELNDNHEYAYKCADGMYRYAIRNGELLCIVKHDIEHGSFIKWINDNCIFKYHNAKRYMRVYKQSQKGIAIPFSSIRCAVGYGKTAHVSNNTGNNEWYTPIKYINAARAVMGGIDLDPASCDAAQNNVGAINYYTKDTNGLEKKWTGRVWMNPPYGKDVITLFVDKFIASLPDIVMGCVLVNNASDTSWMQSLISHSDAVCFINGRISYLDSTGSPSNKPLQGQAVLYFGDHIKRFNDVFSEYGQVLIQCEK